MNNLIDTSCEINVDAAVFGPAVGNLMATDAAPARELRGRKARNLLSPLSRTKGLLGGCRILLAGSPPLESLKRLPKQNKKRTRLTLRGGRARQARGGRGSNLAIAYE